MSRIGRYEKGLRKMPHLAKITKMTLKRSITSLKRLIKGSDL